MLYHSSMRKLFLGFLFLSTQFGTLADACEEAQKIQLAMDSIASNIANIDTTRTPEGGPYQRKELLCQNEVCKIVEYSDVLVKYLPVHLGAF